MSYLPPGFDYDDIPDAEAEAQAKSDRRTEKARSLIDEAMAEMICAAELGLDPVTVFLPYALAPDGRTVAEAFEANGLPKLLLA